MNREIKFRAWDNVTKDMLPNVQNHINDPNWAFGRMLNNKERFSIMQFTGLKDSNGVEIYEGDILTYIATNMSSMEVAFEDGCFIGIGLFTSHRLIDYFEAKDFESIEVTGNIYQQ